MLRESITIFWTFCVAASQLSGQFASLYSTVSSLKLMSGMVVITSPSFSPYCPCWTSGTGWLQLSFVLCFSSCFALSRFAVLWFALPAVGSALLLPTVGSDLVLPAVGSDLVLPAFCFALVLPAVCFALLPAVGFALLPAVGFALLPAVGFALLPAVGFALLPAVGFALLGSFQRCSRSLMFFSLSSYPSCFTSFFSPLAPWLWFLLSFFFRVTLC